MTEAIPFPLPNWEFGKSTGPPRPGHRRQQKGTTGSGGRMVSDTVPFLYRNTGSCTSAVIFRGKTAGLKKAEKNRKKVLTIGAAGGIIVRLSRETPPTAKPKTEHSENRS